MAKRSRNEWQVRLGVGAGPQAGRLGGARHQGADAALPLAAADVDAGEAAVRIAERAQQTARARRARRIGLPACVAYAALQVGEAIDPAQSLGVSHGGRFSTRETERSFTVRV